MASTDTRHIPKSILVVDNDELRSFNLAILCKRFDFNIFSAKQGFEFTRIVNGVLPHIVLLNIRMPLIDGKSCLDYIRGNSNLNMIKVITMSDEGDKAMLEESMTKGADGFITLPVSPTKLYAAIEKLGESRARKVPRLRLIFRATITDGTNSRKAFATVLSENGVFIRSTKPFPKDTKIKVHLDLPSARPIHLDGVVLYTVEIKGGTHKNYEPGMGIKFTDMPPEINVGIRGFIEGQLKTDLDPNVLF